MKYLILLILLSSSIAHAQIFIKDPLITNIEFEKFLAENNNFTGYNQNYTKESNELVESLFSNYEKAVLFKNEEQLQQAKNYFKKIYFKIDKGIYTKALRKIVFYSLLHLSDIENDTSKKSYWVRKALNYASDISIDNSMFDTKTQDAIRSQKKINPWSKYSFSPQLYQLISKFNSIYINGRLQNSKRVIFIPQSKFILELISNTYYPVKLESRRIKINNIEFNIKSFSKNSPCLTKKRFYKKNISEITPNCISKKSIAKSNIGIKKTTYLFSDIIPKIKKNKKKILAGALAITLLLLSKKKNNDNSANSPSARDGF